MRAALAAIASLILTRSCAWAANSPIARVRLQAVLDQSKTEDVLIREELRLLHARLERLDARKRPHYKPHGGIESNVDVVLKYRGRDVTSTEVERITCLINDNPRMSRRKLSFKLCEEWNWTQANGHPRDMVCRGMLLALDRGGYIRLPAARLVFTQPPRRKKSTSIEIEETPLVAPLSEIGEIEIRQVRRTADEGVVESLIERHHYLGYTRIVGEHLKYLITARGVPIGQSSRAVFHESRASRREPRGGSQAS
ncbi:MAG: DUF4338 domain-containing protein [Deltaproteobacteria bacterium]|nr:DUF4338 domain-containing protein [Deltaproteobacteria bacterium]